MCRRSFQSFGNLCCCFVIIGCSLLFNSSSFASFKLHPPQDKLVYTKYVLFVWEPISPVALYQLQVGLSGEDNPFAEPVVDLTDATPATIVKNGLDFGSEYVWRTRGITIENDTSNWSNIHLFRIIELPDSVRTAFDPEIYVPDEMEPGLTISSTFHISWAIENRGDVVWYLPGWNQSVTGHWDLRQLPDGNFSAINRGGVRIFNIYNDTLFSSGNAGVPRLGHHAAYPKSDGNFLMLIIDQRWVRTGEDSLLWRGSNIVEFNREGEITWEWDVWEHISTADYDTFDFNRAPPSGTFDWTHSNACPLDEEEGAIYLSMRNLSRIVKIDYPSGDIIWSMGIDAPSGDVDFGQNLGFYRQHAPELQPMVTYCFTTITGLGIPIGRAPWKYRSIWTGMNLHSWNGSSGTIFPLKKVMPIECRTEIR